jgi:ABC-type phosphate/phosphonate transport system substrate-binding protein
MSASTEQCRRTKVESTKGVSRGNRVASSVGIGLLALGLLAGTNASAQGQRLIMGVFPGVESGQAESVEILDRYLPLADYLTAKTGIKVLVSPVKLPARAMKEMVEGRSIYKLFFGPPVFASEAIHKADYLPIVVEQERIRGFFVVKAESNLQSLKDFGETTRVAMPFPKLLLSILANETLAQQKVILKPDARRHMSSVDGIQLALDNGIVDVAVMRDRILKKALAEKPAAYRAVGQLVDAPGFALIAHKSVPDKLRAKVQQAALGLYEDGSAPAAEARAGLRTSPFVAGKSDEFQALQRMMTTWGS